jgi:tetratricopeptide (TPR) repeat protein
MTDPVTSRPAQPPDVHDAAERDAKVDELLLGGLEHYFAGRFHEAINCWGRVLFLDRSHARARAYIERARSAVAERQRRAEELLHEGVAAFQRGDGGSARELLTSAVDQGGPQDVALSYLGRLDRLEGAAHPPDPLVVGSKPGNSKRLGAADRLFRRGPRPVRVWPLLGLAIAVTILILVATSRDLFAPLLSVDLRWGRPAAASSAAGPSEPLPVPRSADMVLSRVRALFASGRLKDALASLDDVPQGDPLFAEALRLRTEIQRALLESADTTKIPQGSSRPSPDDAGRGGVARE